MEQSQRPFKDDLDNPHDPDKFSRDQENSSQDQWRREQVVEAGIEKSRGKYSEIKLL